LDKQIPQYRKIYEQLRKHIEKGVYKEGDILPSENELCLLHSITRPTVRKAMDMLTNDGFIQRRQGLGSVVQNKPKGIGILSLSGTTSAVGKENLTTKVLVKPELRQWPEKFVFSLSETEIESGCIYFERQRFVNDKPVFYDISFIPNINLPRFTLRNLKNTSLFDILRESYQVEIKGGEQFINAIGAEDKTQDYLKVGKGTPIVYLQRKLKTNRIDFFIYSLLYCHTKDHSLHGIF